MLYWGTLPIQQLEITPSVSAPQTDHLSPRLVLPDSPLFPAALHASPYPLDTLLVFPLPSAYPPGNSGPAAHLEPLADEFKNRPPPPLRAFNVPGLDS